MTELEHYKSRCNHYKAIVTSMIIRLDEDEALMRDLIFEARTLESAPEYNSAAWRELHGIPFD